MSIFAKFHQPKPDDLCVCRHTCISHDQRAHFCVRTGCACMNYVKVTAKNRNIVVMGQEKNE